MGIYSIQTTVRMPLNWYEALAKEAEKERRPAGQMGRVILSKYKGYNIDEGILVITGLRKLSFKKVNIHIDSGLLTKIKRKEKLTMRYKNDILLYVLYLYLNERYNIEQLYN